MKKFSKIVVIALVITVVVAVFSTVSGGHFSEERSGKVVSIEWDEVNLRESHSTSSKVITSLVYGNKVTLTGNSYEYTGGTGEATESWVEVSLPDGTTGWIVSSSVNWDSINYLNREEAQV